ncbi:MAG: 4-hydroxy-tetrahydrodipicolinate reductase [Gammaproteobacteria bacterium]|jgi:4-hydroxy-tetrahydrodipicolinate reductase|nr:dihydrodipicolinate reductase C-terminal domain-containing protein [Pseudomonadota bacterium]GIR08683.1 MAG: 4-hydroxy-tetrahydrodipicolinate reductase [Gammaproteobacteria bacterium]|tara:strand:- start:67 stop:792 length:726 start_codon:yes stop_codon:yes gene_type:complete
MKLSLVGAAGKMGKALTSEVQHNKEFEITNYVVKPNSSLLGKDVGSIHFNQQSNSLFVDDPKNAFDMFVDFADAQNISSRIQMYKKHCKPLIFCSTGLSSDEEKSIIALSEKMPVFIAPNTSVVTALMKDFAKKISKIDQSLEIHISESHNKSKKDAPSGTAKDFARMLQLSTDKIEFDRTDEDKNSHKIAFSNNFESLELRHDTANRSIYAQGALNIAKWFYQRPKNLYYMQTLIEEIHE